MGFPVRYGTVRYCLSLSLTVGHCLCLSLSVYLCLSLSLCVSLCLSLSLFVSVFVCLCLSLSVSLCLSVSFCLCYCLSTVQYNTMGTVRYGTVDKSRGSLINIRYSVNQIRSENVPNSDWSRSSPTLYYTERIPGFRISPGSHLIFFKI